ncbi:hypothetical protein HD553DRAFT_47623 [Filobasidium floriforme]|uniref:uncharacterized protein n=1 Tax=Filobasidium floriforme TaxID=5210 RepID=UPI001E8D51AD|nr:uncharacterized protein HD553DRAFT_47623 [Filobasidium floriforme]KAH8083571.1 hypothetical protein HD553DRAFT_47623 [Filobasidium floriforme]
MEDNPPPSVLRPDLIPLPLSPFLARRMNKLTPTPTSTSHLSQSNLAVEEQQTPTRARPYRSEANGSDERYGREELEIGIGGLLGVPKVDVKTPFKKRVKEDLARSYEVDEKELESVTLEVPKLGSRPEPDLKSTSSLDSVSGHEQDPFLHSTSTNTTTKDTCVPSTLEVIPVKLYQPQPLELKSASPSSEPIDVNVPSVRSDEPDVESAVNIQIQVEPPTKRRDPGQSYGHGRSPSGREYLELGLGVGVGSEAKVEGMTSPKKSQPVRTTATDSEEKAASSSGAKAQNKANQEEVNDARVDSATSVCMNTPNKVRPTLTSTSSSSSPREGNVPETVGRSGRSGSREGVATASPRPGTSTSGHDNTLLSGSEPEVKEVKHTNPSGPKKRETNSKHDNLQVNSMYSPENLGVGDKSTFLPDTPGIRRDAWMLNESCLLTRTELGGTELGQIGDDSVIFLSKFDQFTVQEGENEEKAGRASEITLEDTSLDLGQQMNLGSSILGSNLMNEDKEMREALGRVDMTMIGDETTMEGLPVVRPARKVRGMETLVEVPTPRPAESTATVKRSPHKVRNINGNAAETFKCTTSRAGAGLLAPPDNMDNAYETLDLKTMLQRTSILPKDMYGVGKDGKPEWRGDLSVTELMKEDNPFIATAEEQERASRRIRTDGHSTLFNRPTIQAGPSRSAGQSLRNIFSSGSPGSPTKPAPEPRAMNEVEREFSRMTSTDTTQPSRLVFQLDPTLSKDGLKKVDQQAKADEARGTKLKAWEDAKRWTFVMDNMAWARKMQAEGLLHGEQLEKVLKIIYDETPLDISSGVRCPATPVFVKDARRLHPAQTSIRTHRRSASMDPTQTGTLGRARSRATSSGQDLGRLTGHRRNATMDPSQISSSVTIQPSRVRVTSRTSVEAPKPGFVGSGTSRFGNTTRAPSVGTKTSPPKAASRPSAASKPPVANPALGQSRTRTNGTSADQVLASMGIRDPTSRTSRIAAPASRASTNSSMIGRSRVSSTASSVVSAQRASTTASSVITGRASATSNATAARTRMTQPSASGLERTVGRPSEAPRQYVTNRQMTGNTGVPPKRLSSVSATTGLRVERSTTSSRMTATRTSTRGLP